MTATYAPARARTQRQAQKQAEAVHLEGSSHAAIGFVAGIGIGLLTAGAHRGDTATADAIIRDLLFGFTAAGLSLLPDSDHPDASFAHAGGALSHVVSNVVALLFGGHRQGMHSIFGVALMCLVVASCSLWWPNHWALGGLALLLAVCIAAGLNATRRRRRPLDSFLWGCVLAGLAVWVVRGDLWWLCALGMALHIGADELTGHGCALFWPISRRRFGGDGHQPAAAGKSSAGQVRAKAAKAKAKRTAPTRPGAVPTRQADPWPPQYGAEFYEEPPVLLAANPNVKLWAQHCPACTVGDCRQCEDPKCECTRPRMKHPARPEAKAARPPGPPDDGGPVPF